MPRSINDGAYSPFKIIHHAHYIQKLRDGEHFAPVHVQLVPTNRCNQSCQGCAYRMVGYTSNQGFRDGDEIPWDKLTEIVNDCEKMGVRAIEITGGGEPSVHPDFLRLSQMILDAGIDLGVVTNGTKIGDTARNILVHAKWIRFSIDAGTALTYAEYRKTTPRVYGEVRDNLRELVRLRNATKTELLIGVGFVVNRKNWTEVVEAAQRARDDGADNIRISALFHQDGTAYFAGFYEHAKGLCYQAQAMEREGFRVFNLFGDRIQDMDAASPDYPVCGYSRLVTYIGADLGIYTCCNNAYNDMGRIGLLVNRSFYDAWQSEGTKRFLEEFNPATCERCMFNNKNRTILYAMDDHPRHVNFL